MRHYTSTIIAVDEYNRIITVNIIFFGGEHTTEVASLPPPTR